MADFKILIVDDEIKDLFMIRAAVEKCLRLLKTYSDDMFLLASNVTEALALAKQYKPRLIITDLFMPSGDMADRKIWSEEMTLPQGLHFLSKLPNDSHTQKLATTFFLGLSRIWALFNTSDKAQSQRQPPQVSFLPRRFRHL